MESPSIGTEPQLSGLIYTGVTRCRLPMVAHREEAPEQPCQPRIVLQSDRSRRGRPADRRRGALPARPRSVRSRSNTYCAAEGMGLTSSPSLPPRHSFFLSRGHSENYPHPSGGGHGKRSPEGDASGSLDNACSAERCPKPTEYGQRDQSRDRDDERDLCRGRTAQRSPGG